MRKVSLIRSFLAVAFTTMLLAPVACGHEHHAKECADKCAEAERVCNGHHERECGEQAHKCLEVCEH
jgi:hypothetical protein